MKTMCLMLILAATPVLADCSQSPNRGPQDPYGAAKPIAHADKIFDSRRQQIPQTPKPGAEKPLGTG